MKRDSIIFLVIIGLLIVGLNPQFIGEPFKSREASVGVYTDAYHECALQVGYQRNSNPGVSWQEAGCRACPNYNVTTQSRCYLGCGEPCPAGAQCNYPLYCNQVCPTPGSSNCRTDRTFWDPALRGVCTPGGEEKPGAFLYMLQKDEAGTEKQAQLEALYQSTCFPPVNTTQPPEPQPVQGGVNWLLVGGIVLAGIVGGGYLLGRRKR